MRDQPKSVLLRFCKAWERQELNAALDVVHSDIVYAMFIPQEVVPFGGETRGRPAMADRMRMILDQFEMQRFEVVDARMDNEFEHARVAYTFRHKVTGEAISGVMRIVVIVKDNLIIDLKEYHDLEKVHAFMRLVAYRAAECSSNDF